MGTHNVWVYCFESRELLCMPTAQRSQCRYFAYQLWREREETGCLDFTGRQGQGAVALENSQCVPSRTGGWGDKQNIDTGAKARGQVDTSYYRAGFDKLHLLG